VARFFTQMTQWLGRRMAAQFFRHSHLRRTILLGGRRFRQGRRKYRPRQKKRSTLTMFAILATAMIQGAHEKFRASSRFEQCLKSCRPRPLLLVRIASPRLLQTRLTRRSRRTNQSKRSYNAWLGWRLRFGTYRHASPITFFAANLGRLAMRPSRALFSTPWMAIKVEMWVFFFYPLSRCPHKKLGNFSDVCSTRAADSPRGKKTVRVRTVMNTWSCFKNPSFRPEVFTLQKLPSSGAESMLASRKFATVRQSTPRSSSPTPRIPQFESLIKKKGRAQPSDANLIASNI